ncbi:MAG: alpha/beta hydrolase [Desulfobacteraceae bacterium]|nr:MAG: alpha/beta hydrolase [Desulfobacteraceae bacterium]
MNESNENPYHQLDHPLVTARVFHPRGDYPMRPGDENRADVMIPVAENVLIGTSFHHLKNPEQARRAPVILFFHGNGEIVSDYDDLGPVFTAMGVNLFVADYRGYGQSTGVPCVSAMMADCHHILDFLSQWMIQNGYAGPIVVMGRSLGSASAIELASRRSDDVAALIVESGFAYAGALLSKLGIDPEAVGFDERSGFGNLEKIARYQGPVLVIHAEFDHIIPFSDGQALFDASPGPKKNLLQIDGANHNDIFMRGMDLYLKHVKAICLESS